MIVRHDEEVWEQTPRRRGVVLSTSLTGQDIHRNKVYLRLLELLECEQVQAVTAWVAQVWADVSSEILWSI